MRIVETLAVLTLGALAAGGASLTLGCSFDGGTGVPAPLDAAAQGDSRPPIGRDGTPRGDVRASSPDHAPPRPADGRARDSEPPPVEEAFWDGPFGEQDRPAELRVPEGYRPSHPLPLVVLLHGYSAWGTVQDFYLQLSAIADREQFFFIAPDGLVDPVFSHYWNATDACCDLFGSGVDDVGYLRRLIDEIKGAYAIDGKRVYIVGHSNGAFMSHRLACEIADRVAAIASLAGAQWHDESRCKVREAVAVVEIHGTLDSVIYYNGGRLPHSDLTFPEYPGAEGTVATWAKKNGCSGGLASGGDDLDLDAVVPGAETTVQRYSGCQPHGEVELWTMHGSAHVPIFNSSFSERVWGFLKAHPKP